MVRFIYRRFDRFGSVSERFIFDSVLRFRFHGSRYGFTVILMLFRTILCPTKHIFHMFCMEKHPQKRTYTLKLSDCYWSCCFFNGFAPGKHRSKPARREPRSEEMGAKGRVKAAFSLSWDKCAEVTEKAYQEFLRRLFFFFWVVGLGCLVFFFFFNGVLCFFCLVA